ncbi:hypothetical protein HDV62DRAFT_2773 [Trichoderma sp. SZMC 28011]
MRFSWVPDLPLSLFSSWSLLLRPRVAVHECISRCLHWVLPTHARTNERMSELSIRPTCLFIQFIFRSDQGPTAVLCPTAQVLSAGRNPRADRFED